MSHESVRDIWRKKLDFLLVEEAKVSDSAQKFKIQEEIAEAKAKLKELGGRESDSDDTALRVSPTRLRHGSEKFVGREKELGDLDKAWDDSKKHVVTIVAWPGEGKTALVVDWMARMAAAGWRGAERVFDWSFCSHGSSDAFVANALEFFGDSETSKSNTQHSDEKDPRKKGEHLARLVAKRKTLLVLDGVESLQYPPGPDGGKLKDRTLEALLKGLAQQNKGLCLVTSRKTLTDLAPWQDTTSPEWKLDSLSEEAGSQLLFHLECRRAGNGHIRADDDELKQAATEVRGHALTLQLLGRYLAKAHNGDIRKRTLVAFEKADAKVQGGHAFKVMRALEIWLHKGGGEGRRQVAVLYLLGLFDSSSEAGCLAALRREPAIRGLTEPLIGLEDEDWNYTVSSLSECDIISVNTDQSMIDCHPLVREYFSKSLRAKRPNAWREAHGRLYEHLIKTSEYQPDTVEDMQPLFQAVAHACQAGIHQQALTEVLRKRIWRETPEGILKFFSTKRLGTIDSELALLRNFFERPWHQPSNKLDIKSKTLILHAAGFRLRACARLGEANIALNGAQEAYIKLSDWKQAADVAGNLNELCVVLDHLAEAVDHGKASVDLADRSGGDERLYRRAEYARALHLAGDWPKARKMFTEAEAIQRHSGGIEWLYSLAGFYYCDFLLDRVGSPDNSESLQRLEEVKARASTGLKRAEEPPGHLRDIPLYCLILGRAHLCAAMLYSEPMGSIAEQYLDRAVDGLKKAGRNDHVCDALLVRAATREVNGNLLGAKDDLSRAWKIAERGGMRLYMADVLLHRGWLFHDKKELAEVRKLIDECGYHRRDAELADAEESAKGW